MNHSSADPPLALQWIGNVIFAEYEKEVVIDLEMAKRSVEKRIKFTSKKNAGLVFDLRNVKHIEIDARKFLGTDTSTHLITAGAVIINSPIQKILANFFLRFSRPQIPTRLFTNRHEAIEWVNETLIFCKINERNTFSILQ